MLKKLDIWHLELEGLCLKELPNFVLEQENLKSLSLYKNNFWQCEELNGLKNLTFLNLSKNFKGIETWNVENVVNMEKMFYKAKFFNHNINSWNTKSLKNMESIFEECEKFNQPLDNWNVSKVTNMMSMFDGELSPQFPRMQFNQPLDKWDVRNVKNIEKIFYMCGSFSQNIDSWEVRQDCRISKYGIDFSYSNMEKLPKWYEEM